MNNLAIIPARGGSKRIPRKNIKDFLGKPIIAYSIEAAVNSGLFNEVMVSTDDAEIAAIAKQYGATVPFIRSVENSNDFAATVDVLKEVELNYQQEQNRIFDHICCIYPTAPLIKQAQLTEGIKLLIQDNLDVVFPIVEFSYPIWRGVEIFEGKTKMVWPEYINSRSQDLKKVYHDAGQWYWYRPDKITYTLFTKNTASVILKEEEVQDIDTLTDWSLAEIKYRYMQNKIT
jgi:pseudaminic acid cytidylyltransferase